MNVVMHEGRLEPADPVDLRLQHGVHLTRQGLAPGLLLSPSDLVPHALAIVEGEPGELDVVFRHRVDPEEGLRQLVGP
jgi:hypothetical protein